jgi:hypothetical protein
VTQPLTHALLAACGVEHGFGMRGFEGPPGLRRPRQVHGASAVDAAACAREPLPEADAVISREPGVPVGVVTADCVPILVASTRGDAVAAIHAGWRGLARGVVEAGIDALRHAAPGAPLCAVVGPHIGPCCYEVDAPVIEALRAPFGAALADAIAPARVGHARLDLAALARAALLRAGLARPCVAELPRSCTRCEPERFHSYRRDGARAGRLVHFIAAGPGLTSPRGSH